MILVRHAVLILSSSIFCQVWSRFIYVLQMIVMNDITVCFHHSRSTMSTFPLKLQRQEYNNQDHISGRKAFSNPAIEGSNSNNNYNYSYYCDYCRENRPGIVLKLGTHSLQTLLLLELGCPRPTWHTMQPQVESDENAVFFVAFHIPRLSTPFTFPLVAGLLRPVSIMASDSMRICWGLRFVKSVSPMSTLSSHFSAVFSNQPARNLDSKLNNGIARVKTVLPSWKLIFSQFQD